MRRTLLASLALVAACSSTGIPSLDATGALFARAEMPEIEVRAPEALRAARDAWSLALDAQARGQGEVAADYATEARLLLRTAIYQARRLSREEESEDLLAQAAEVQATIAAFEDRARVAEAEIELGRVQRFAAREAQAAYDRAITDEARRYRTTGDLREPRVRAISEAWGQRTLRVLDIVDALVEGEPSSPLRARLATTLRNPANESARPTLDAIWFDAIALLRDHATPLQAGVPLESIVRALEGYEGQLSRQTYGLVLDLNPLFTRGTQTPNAEAMETLTEALKRQPEGVFVFEFSGSTSTVEARKASFLNALPERHRERVRLASRPGRPGLRAVYPLP